MRPWGGGAAIKLTRSDSEGAITLRLRGRVGLVLKQANPTGLAPVARGILHDSVSREINGSVVQNPVNHWGKPSGVAGLRFSVSVIA